MLSNKMYKFLLCVSCFVIYFSFDYASNCRMAFDIYSGMGSEWLTLLLPIILYVWRIKSINKEREE